MPAIGFQEKYCIGVWSQKTFEMRQCIAFISLFLVLSGHVYAETEEVFREIKSQTVTVRFERGLGRTAEEILQSIPSIRSELERKLGLSADFSIVIVLYKNSKNFKKISRTDMISAFAIPEQRLIVIDDSKTLRHPLDIKLIVMHEMCHLVLSHHIPRSNLPKWLNEGISQWISGGAGEIISPASTNSLKMAFISKNVLPFSGLSRTFPSDRNSFILSYEQSKSIVEYIEETYGDGSVQSIISRLASGSEFDEAIGEELSVNFRTLEHEWKEKMTLKYTWVTYLSNNIYWILFITGALLTVFAFIKLRKRIRDYKDDDEDDYYDPDLE